MPDDPRDTLSIPNPKGKSQASMAVELAVSADIGNTVVMRQLLLKLFPGADLTEMVRETRSLVRQIQSGNLAHLEGLLASQSLGMSAAYTELMNRFGAELMAEPSRTEKALALCKAAAELQNQVVRTTLALKSLVYLKRSSGARTRLEIDG